MSELEILHQEPRHRVTTFADEVLERRRMTIQTMRPALTALIVGLCDYFEGIKLDVPHLDYACVVLAETKWTRDGKFVFEIGYETKQGTDRGARYHVDDLIADIVSRESRLTPLVDEFSQFLAALVDQFSTIKKSHQTVDLSKITFENQRGLDKDIIFDIKLDGKPFGYREARW